MPQHWMYCITSMCKGGVQHKFHSPCRNSTLCVYCSYMECGTIFQFCEQARLSSKPSAAPAAAMPISPPAIDWLSLPPSLSFPPPPVLLHPSLVPLLPLPPPPPNIPCVLSEGVCYCCLSVSRPLNLISDQWCKYN